VVSELVSQLKDRRLESCHIHYYGVKAMSGPIPEHHSGSLGIRKERKRIAKWSTNLLRLH